MTNKRTKTAFAVFLATLMIGSVLGGVVVAAPSGNNKLDYSAGPNVVITEDHVTIAAHNRSEMTSVLQYYGDNGDVKTLNAEVNRSAEDNPLRIRYDKIEDDDFQEFPRKGEANNDASWADTSEWTTSVSDTTNTALTLSDADGEPADGVEAIQIATGGSMGSGDTATATYANFSLDDPNKRVLTVIFNVNTLDSAAVVEFRAKDSDADYKAVEVNSSASTSSVDVAANSTGNGYVMQVKLSELSVKGSGDGSMSSIEKVKVRIKDADADVTITYLDLGKKSKIDLGEYVNSADETVTRRNVTNAGQKNLTTIASLGDWSDNAVIHDLEVHNLRYEASRAPAENVMVEFSEASAYSYPSKLETHQRVKVPAAIDLTHSGLTLEAKQKFVEPRYATIEYKEDATADDLENVSSWSDLESTYSSEGTVHTLDSTVQAGQNYQLHAVILLKDDEVKDLRPASGGGAGGPVKSGGGFWSNPINWLIGAAVSLLGGLGIKMSGG